ncbi:MAG: trimethylamine methyltransferase family protein [Deltaproteobacteria bacterium]|jgi:trimethylamine--corrinoid protein Co-methyltransferase|nr:trimethylamine methyltransferase family protein [Deltaproteobacteria bacterium]
MLPLYDSLTSEEITKIHEASLKVLEETGILLSHHRTLDILYQKGAKISKDRQRVFMPRDFVEEMIKLCPNSFPCAAIKPENDLVIERGRRYTRMIRGPVSLFDLSSARAYPMRFEDNMDAARLANRLPNIHITSSMTPQDIDLATYDIKVLKGLLEHSEKHLWAYTCHSSHLKYQMEMATAVAGSLEKLRERPILSGIFCVIDPLRYPDDELERLFLWGNYSIPVRVPINALVGGNAPYTLAGTMTQMNAEFLSSTAIIQALFPGLGVWYYCLPQVLNRNIGKPVANGPELMYLYASSATMARYYGVPSTYASGAITCNQGHQLMYHFGMNQTLATIMGVTEQGGAGSVMGAYAYSHEALAIMDESMAYLDIFAGEKEYSLESLATSDIRASFESGEFATSKLTLKRLEKDKWFTPTLFDWSDHDQMERRPDTILDRAEQKVNEILKNPEPEPLPPEVLKELDRIMEAAEKEFA